MEPAGRLDYLVIGHVTRDRVPGGSFSVGGTVAYAGRAAQALGCHVGVVTSAEETLNLDHVIPHAAIQLVQAPATTTFGNEYTPAGRAQTVETVAAPLTADAVPPAWRNAGVVHLGPVARECDPSMAEIFPTSFLGLTPQGWMRRWDEAGRVHTAPWESADALLPLADAVVISEEDVEGDEKLVSRWAARTSVLVVTRGAAGCTMHVGGNHRSLPGFPAVEEDPTGAGDVFAAALFVRMWQGDDPWTAARLANCVAAVSVGRPGLSGTPTPAEVMRCRALCA